MAFEVQHDLAGWTLSWVRVRLLGATADVGELRTRAVATARRRWSGDALSADPTVAALRALFRAAGCDPTRYRPSSEALLRRVLKGDELPAIHPLVDLNNCLSIELAVPCCVVADGSIQPPVTLRAGRAGETFESLRGPFSLEGKPLLADAAGPFGTPITDSQRVKVLPATQSAWIVAYQPAGIVSPAHCEAALAALLATAPVAMIEESFATPG